MNNKNIKLIIIVGIIIVVFIKASWNCIILQFKSLPEILFNKQNINDVIILYGSVVCASCPTGVFLYSYKNKENVLIVVPKSYTKNDIDNLKNTFSIQGKIEYGDNEFEEYLRSLSKCIKSEMWQQSLHAKLENRKIMKIKRISKLNT